MEAGRGRKADSLPDEVDSGILEASNPSIPETVDRFCILDEMAETGDAGVSILALELDASSGLYRSEKALEVDEGVAVGNGGGGMLVLEEGNWRMDPLVGLGFVITSFALLILASQPLTKSTDFPARPCPYVLSIPIPNPTSFPVGAALCPEYSVSRPLAIIRATFLLIGVLGGEFPLPAIAANELKLLAEFEPGVVR
jgi:hypothetical protein